VKGRNGAAQQSARARRSLQSHLERLLIVVVVIVVAVALVVVRVDVASALAFVVILVILVILVVIVVIVVVTGIDGRGAEEARIRGTRLRRTSGRHAQVRKQPRFHFVTRKVHWSANVTA
jgi:hypothetical protein